MLVQTTSPKRKVMLNSDAIHIVPLLWAGLGPQATCVFRIQLRHPAPPPIHSHRQKIKQKMSFVRHVGPIVACRRLRRQGSMYFPLFPPFPFPLPVGVKQPAASGSVLCIQQPSTCPAESVSVVPGREKLLARDSPF